ncbi:MAG TPA: neutral zinc metallopeptidase [Kofleriaceae bacterium]|nr:neutral zinc metallopeptidase [Kofleriaceae bacterium]
MRWDRGHQSPNIEDRRGQGGAGINIGGLGLLLPLIGRFGWRGILILVALFLVVNYTGLCSGGGGGSDEPRRGAVAPSERAGAPQDDLARFVGFVLDDAQETFRKLVEAEGGRYQAARMVLFTDAVSSACGSASSAVGPFYCPLDRRVYIDLSFYRELQRRFGASGDFAEAYVIAHEVGHHLQNLSGKLERGGSVDTELQADCLAGVWAHSAGSRDLLEPGDMEEALDAAAAVGDDNIQKKTTGTVRPETWTHGSSEQRQAAFRRGYQGGTLSACSL